jgi:cyclophilin family peptidyl-prolyl cis-trans isomerase
MLAPRRLLCCTALLTGAGAFGACGTTGSDTAATAASHAGSRGAGPAHASADGDASVCRHVSAPRATRLGRVAPPTQKLDPAKRYVVTLTTNCGKIAIALDVRSAPRTTASFAYLVKRHFYDHLTFHRIAAGYVIQGGDPDGDGTGGPGYTVVEQPPRGLRYTFGTVAMAKSESDPPGASGSQFFIVTAHSTALPPEYALVGNVIGSMRAVEAIGHLSTDPPEDGAPRYPVVISQATLSASR